MSCERRDYEFAVLSQDACNLSALAYDLANVMDNLWAEAREKGLGTDYVNTHPIVQLYIAQMFHLAYPKCPDPITDEWQEAFRVCQARAKEVVCGLMTVKPLAPAEYVGDQVCPGMEPLPLFVLTASIPGHPVGSTVSAKTLREAGYAVPNYRTEK